MRVTPLLYCPHGKPKYFLVEDALPGDPVPEMERCDVCDAESKILEP